MLALVPFTPGIGDLRKVKEAITALKIEALYSKNEILETCLNTVPFLYNAFGIEMAARTYFDKSVKELDVLKGTSYHNPVLDPKRARTRRNLVLAQMARDGTLDPARVDALTRQPLNLNFERQIDLPGPAPHLAQYLRKWLVAWADDNDYNIHMDGLRVVATLDVEAESFRPCPRGASKRAGSRRTSAVIARAMTSICNDEPGRFGVQGGHGGKPLSLSASQLVGSRRFSIFSIRSRRRS